MARFVKVLKHRATIFLLAIAGLVVIFLLVAPPAIRFFAIDWLKEHGASHAQIANVRLNPFTGTLVLHGIKASDNLQIGKLGIEIDWWPLWHHDIYIQNFDIEDSNLGLITDKKGQWKIKGLNIPSYDNNGKSTSNSGKETWRPLLNSATLKNIHIKLASHDLIADIPIHSLQLNHAYMVENKSQMLNIEMQLGRFIIASHGYHLSDAGLRFQGQLTVPGQTTPFSSRKMTLVARNLTVESKANPLLLTIDYLHVSGASVHGTTDFNVGDIEIKALKIGNNPNNSSNIATHVSLTSIRKISIHKVSVSSAKHADFASMDIQSASLPATKKQSLGSIGSITAVDGSFTPGSIRLNQLNIQALSLLLEHNKNGIAVLSQIKGDFSPSTPAAIKGTANTSSSSMPNHIDIGLITVDKGSKIDFRDNTISPPFHSNLQVNTMRISSLDTSGAKSGKLEMDMKLGNQGQLTANGTLKLNGSKSKTKLSLAIKRLSMPSLTGYMEKDFGQAIKTGQMDLDSKFSLKGDVIEAKNKLAIRNLKLENSPQSGKVLHSPGMPINTAVDMLRDDKGDIFLNVPINGRIDNPKFDLHDAIDQALMSAMKTAAVSYAALLLQPYGSILPAISLASSVIGQISKPRLTPISFVADKSTLSVQAKAYIIKITELLKKKPFRLQVCGVSSSFEIKPKSKATPTKEENLVRNKRMLSLAKARSAAVIKAIVSGGISADRVFNCLPTIDNKPNAVGRVELLLN